MSFAKRMQGVADKLLNKFDERTGDNKIMLIKAGASSYNETTRETEFEPDTIIPLTGVVVPYSSGLVDGTAIQAGDARLTVTNEQEPLHPDKILLDGVEWSIVDIDPYAYTGKDLTIAYAIQIRK